MKIWNLREQKNLNIEKIIFKVVQMKFLAMHITNHKLSFDIFTVEHLQNISWNNDSKTEIIIFGPSDKAEFNNSVLGNLSVFNSSCVCNLGVLIDIPNIR